MKGKEQFAEFVCLLLKIKLQIMEKKNKKKKGECLLLHFI